MQLSGDWKKIKQIKFNELKFSFSNVEGNEVKVT